MKVAFFSTKPYERKIFEEVNRLYHHQITFFEPRLTNNTAGLTTEFPAVCIFVNDQLDSSTLEILSNNGIKLIALRCAGFNNVDLIVAKEKGITVVRVPAYSPHSVAEHTLALILALNRKIHRAYNRIREGNFALDGLLGFDLFGRTVGIIGTGKIGAEVSKIMTGFGCTVIAHDHVVNPVCEKIGVKYVELDKIFSESDIITLHCPLTPDTYHLIDSKAIEKMKKGVVLINTSRGALIDTINVIRALKSGKIGYLGLDVYEEEGDLFFEDLSNKVLQDDVFARLITFPNVIITGHQAFFTKEALQNIAETTSLNIKEFEETGNCKNQVILESIKK
ncbi:MAG: 2-hydroxyacid dehydrogenase [Ignavibacteriales bacterium]|nr:2-hydroxyacid dehydrogenase [Ignavibacteriales bacterium]